ncbi:hypothetical protein IIA15_01055 [candidate division TA06 bacterium]|nr:hypothetical protein [candidate division TA06 bacterium]
MAESDGIPKRRIAGSTTAPITSTTDGAKERLDTSSTLTSGENEAGISNQGELQINSFRMREMLFRILQTLEKMEKHLSLITQEDIEDKDLEINRKK